MSTDAGAAFFAAYPFHFEHEVEFREIDIIGHVNNVRYAEWSETMRLRYFDDVLGKKFDDSESVIVARHDMEYVAQVAYRERVIVGGTITRFGTKSLDFTTEVWSPAHERTVFRSVCVLVAFDYAANRSIVIPAAWRSRQSAFQIAPS